MTADLTIYNLQGAAEEVAAGYKDAWAKVPDVVEALRQRISKEVAEAIDLYVLEQGPLDIEYDRDGSRFVVSQPVRLRLKEAEEIRAAEKQRIRAAVEALTTKGPATNVVYNSAIYHVLAVIDGTVERANVQSLADADRHYKTGYEQGYVDGHLQGQRDERERIRAAVEALPRLGGRPYVDAERALAAIDAVKP